MRKRRFGFTLVELLVVIAIIAMLAALIVPAVQGALIRGKQNTCNNNLRQIGVGLIAHATNKQFFPGYRNNPATTFSGALPISGQTAILPYIEQKSLYDKWSASTGFSISDPLRYPNLEVMICPADSTASGTSEAVTSFAVNAGQPGNDTATVITARYNGVCHDLWVTATNTLPIRNRMRLGLQDFNDGAGNTVLATENMDANLWHIDNTPTLTLPADPEDIQAVIFWLPTAAGGPQYRINEKKGLRGPTDSPATPFTANHPKYARPSAGHGTTFNVLFADGHTKAIEETVTQELTAPTSSSPPALIWDMLMTPWGVKCTPSQIGTLSGSEF